MTDTARISLLLLAAIATLCLFMQTAAVPADAAGSSDPKEIILYSLFPTTGSLTSQGEAEMTAFELAVSDINRYLTAIGSDLTVVPQVVEMDSGTESARDRLMKLHDTGAVAILAYISSSQADAVRDYCKANGILLVSTGSSSPSLAAPDDNLVRLNPDDTVQARVTAGLLAGKGVTHVLPLVRDDLWGRGLVNALSQSLPDGVAMVDGVYYSPEATSYTDYVSDLDQKTANLLNSVSPEEVAIYAASFSEIQEIMAEASGIRYDNLSKVSWVGCDGNALLPELTGGSVPAEYALTRNFTAITFGSDPKNRQDETYRSLAASLGGDDPDGYTLAMYDAAWILCKTLLMDGTEETPSLQEAFLKMAEQQNGLSGNMRFNRNADRYTGTYQVWRLTRDEGGAHWELEGSAEVRDENPDPSTIAITSFAR